ncbi:HrpT family type III secretion system protein [Vibrio mangrovi]|uniref:HrpT family type III secretion system protein n=1 Tax=Vibrio mangrovi TaxID=474394 RepID=A0A1Y6IXU8_9VIBR|nr:HrpT family type III secretion system protein [Vibrio mangrovi]MDW6001979.1 HrpT family type III secretion system protein [Vibrio mangrovi]SMS02474.1 hypothetical protein VIM7927_03807 [Vibrio mangrovi]
MRIFISLILLLLAGCASVPQETAECTVTQCDRPLSTANSLVIWWGPGMRHGLEDGEETTSYDLTH